MNNPNSKMTLSRGASLVTSRLITLSSPARISAAKSALDNCRSRDSMGKLDALKMPLVQRLTTIGSYASADWTARAMGRASAEQPHEQDRAWVHVRDEAVALPEANGQFAGDIPPESGTGIRQVGERCSR